MIHYMKLQAAPFEKIKSGCKTIELRLNDEKRQKVAVGDFIEFSRIDDPERKIQTRVTALHKYASFSELYAVLPKEKFGYASDENADPDDMDKFYPREKQEQYGVLGIELYYTDLQKFLDAQEKGYGFGETYKTALKEMREGYKDTHWIWYVFPQIRGLGLSGTTALFSINDLTEAKDYFDHPVLGARLKEITETLLDIPTDDPLAVFEEVDALKLRSCMTLFKHTTDDNELFKKVLDKVCLSNEDDKTLKILGLF